jgi:hypothetical protein
MVVADLGRWRIAALIIAGCALAFLFEERHNQSFPRYVKSGKEAGFK